MTHHHHSRLQSLAVLAGVAAALGCAHGTAPPPAAAPFASTRVARAPVSRRQSMPAAESPSAPAVADGAIYFDFDSALLRDEARSFLKKVASGLAKEGEKSLVIEGNCDELGTIEYNLALGDERARSAKDYLSHLGVPVERIRTLSYGSQRPKFAGHDDVARAKNRRDDLRVQ